MNLDMDDNLQRDNGRHKVDQYKSMHAQWMIPQHQMKDNQTLKLMAILAERDKAFQDHNLALSEKKSAFAERDMAMLQRDAAISERNSAIAERDNAVSALEYARENGVNLNGGPHGSKHQHHHLQHVQNQHLQISDVSYNHTREHISEAYPLSAVSETGGKAHKAKRQRKVVSKSPRKGKRANDTMRPEDDLNKHHREWKDQDLGLNQVAFDDSSMPIPVCSCTGKYRPCYKWGQGGWQSSCCTTTLSVYPLPIMPNKRHARVGGRKMSGNVFTRLLNRLAAEGHDLSVPMDLKDHWAKHGTNRYITIK